MLYDAGYSCPHCGEWIETSIDPSAATQQSYVEDCPVCCRPIVLSVRLGDQDEIDIEARQE